jgi:hypothetical protein
MPQAEGSISAQVFFLEGGVKIRALIGVTVLERILTDKLMKKQRIFGVPFTNGVKEFAHQLRLHNSH